MKKQAYLICDQCYVTKAKDLVSRKGSGVWLMCDSCNVTIIRLSSTSGLQGPGCVLIFLQPYLLSAWVFYCSHLTEGKVG